MKVVWVPAASLPATLPPVPGLSGWAVSAAHDTAWDGPPGVVSLWFDAQTRPHDALAQALDGHAWVVQERVQWDLGPVGVVRVSFVRRASALTRPQFAAHWADVHAPLARRHHPSLARYVQNVVVEPLTPGTPEVDGIAELGFVSLEDMNERMYDSPEGATKIKVDVAGFIDVSVGWRLLTRPPAAPPPSP